MAAALALVQRTAFGRFDTVPNDVRLWAKVAGPWNTPDVGPDDCWYFGGRSKNRWGYPRFHWRDDHGWRNIGAHVAAFILTYGPVPPGRVVCHSCDHKCCCNPHHHFAGTLRENTRDMVAKGRAVWQRRTTAAA